MTGFGPVMRRHGHKPVNPITPTTRAFNRGLFVHTMITKSITYMATPDYGVGACVWVTIDGTTHIYYGEPEKYWKRDRLELTVPDGVPAGAGLFDCIEDADIEIGATFIVEGGHNDTPPGAVHTSWGDFRRLVESVGGEIVENSRKSQCGCCDTIFDEDAR